MKKPFLVLIAVGAVAIAGGGYVLTSSPSETATHGAAPGPGSKGEGAQPDIARGVVVAVTDSGFEIKRGNGSQRRFEFADKVGMMAVTIATLAEIREGSYVGAAAAPDGKGGLRAIEVHVFDEALRGMGEGHQVLDTARNNSMTNGTVGTFVKGAGSEMTIRYKGKEKKIAIPAHVPVALVAPGTRDQLVAGAHVVVIAGPGGKTAANVLVGLNGIKPPL